MPRRPLTDKQREIRSQANADVRTIRAASENARSLEATRTQELAAREAGHTQARARTDQILAHQRTVRNVQGAVVNTATPSNDSNIVMVTIFTMFGLIFVYLLVTSSANLSGFLGGLQTWVHTLSSNTPLFVTNPKQ